VYLVAMDRKSKSTRADHSDESWRRTQQAALSVAAKLLKEETLSGNDVYDVCWRNARNVVWRHHLEKGKRLIAGKAAAAIGAKAAA
jgi:hypothetical protein